MPGDEEPETRASRHALRGGTAVVSGQLVRIALQFLGLIVLSRLLDPRDFGIIAIAQILLMLGEVVRDLGLTTAAIQADEVTREQHNNLFWLNVAIGTALSLIMAAIASSVARLYGMPELTAVVLALAPLFVLSSVQNQFQVDLLRRYRFGIVSASDVVAQAFGLAAAIVAASRGLGYWSLVWQILVSAVVLLVIRVWAAEWRPGRPRRGAGTGPLVKYGIRLSVAQVLTFSANNSDTAVLGWRTSVTDLGFYNRAFQLVMAPVNQMLTPLTNVAVPILARSRHDMRHFRSHLRHAQALVFIPSIWGMATVAALGTPIIQLLLGDAWSATGELVSILAIAGAFAQMNIVGYWAFLSLALTGDYLRFNLITKVGTVVFILIGSQWGVLGVSWALVGSRAVAWVVMQVWLQRTASLPFRVPMLLGLGYMFAGVASGFAAAAAFRVLEGIASAPAIALSALVSAAVFGAVLALIPGLRRTVRHVAAEARGAVRSSV